MSMAQIERGVRSASAVPHVGNRDGSVCDGVGHVERNNKIVGMFAVAVVPAVFWAGLVWLVCALTGIGISYVTLTIIGSVVTLFLTIIGSALIAST